MKKSKLFFATQNQGKLTEVKELLKNLDFQLLSLNDFPEFVNIEVKETGSTLAENAFLKAEFFAKKTGLLSFADDSGLFVEALNGFPGVNSNRWLLENDSGRNIGLLKKLKDAKNRRAEFKTVICLYEPKATKEVYFAGSIQGSIAVKETGSDGFGYDPIFIPEGFSQSFAQLGVFTKNKLSHRFKALEKLRKYLIKQS